MKKFAALLLAVLLAFSLFSCTTNSSTAPRHTGKKLAGQITGASSFSDGLAFVSIDENEEKTYCINKKGYIVFELDKDLTVMGDIYNRFINGYALVENGICNTKGKIVYPQDVGATTFYGIALEGGYILTEKVTSDYQNTRKELGVMNTDFKWVLEPSEDLYNEVGDSLFETSALNTESFYSDGFIYFAEVKKFLDVKTGELLDPISVEQPSNTWQIYRKSMYDIQYVDLNEEVMVDLSEHDNITNVTQFVNDKAAVLFYNKSARKHYFTVIDTSGTFLFEPVETQPFESIDSYGIASLEFNGECIVISNDLGLGSCNHIQSYNSKGEFMGELKTSTLPYSNYMYSWEFKDNVISVRGGYGSSHCFYYYNPDFTPLFEQIEAE